MPFSLASRRLHAPHATFLSLLLLEAAAACSGGSADAPGSQEDGGVQDVAQPGRDASSAETGPNAPPDATVTDDGSPDSDTGSDASETGAPSKKNGTITVDLTLGTARFSDIADTTLPPEGSGAFFQGCTVTTAGACKVTKCPSPDSVDAGADAGDASAAPIQPNTGIVTITGGTGFPDGGLVFTPIPQNGAHAYYPNPRFKTGDTLTVTSAGATIPAITAQTVTAPADLQLQSPTFTPASDGGITGSFPDIALGSDLTLTWKTTTSTAVMVILTTPHADFSFENLVCTFPGSAGTATIPTATLSNLGKTGAAPAGFLEIAAANQTAFKAGDYAVTFSAQEQVSGSVNTK